MSPFFGGECRFCNASQKNIGKEDAIGDSNFLVPQDFRDRREGGISGEVALTRQTLDNGSFSPYPT